MSGLKSNEIHDAFERKNKENYKRMYVLRESPEHILKWLESI